MAIRINNDGAIMDGENKLPSVNNTVIREDGTIETKVASVYPRKYKVNISNPPSSPLESKSRIERERIATEESTTVQDTYRDTSYDLKVKKNEINGGISKKPIIIGAAFLFASLLFQTYFFVIPAVISFIIVVPSIVKRNKLTQESVGVQSATAAKSNRIKRDIEDEDRDIRGVIKNSIEGDIEADRIVENLLEKKVLSIEKYNEIRRSEYLALAEIGNVSAQKWMGLESNINNNFQESLSWYTKAAEQGDTDAMCSISHGYRFQEIMGSNEYDPLKAYQWSLRAAKAGNTRAMIWVGLDYMTGKVVDYDIKKSEFWFKKAVENGNLQAYKYLGDIYKLPDDISGEIYNQDEAERCYLYAMESRDETTCSSAAYALGMMYGSEIIFDGIKSTKTNAKKAIYWFYQALWSGDSIAEDCINAILNKINVHVSDSEFEQWKQECLNRISIRL